MVRIRLNWPALIIILVVIFLSFNKCLCQDWKTINEIAERYTVIISMIDYNNKIRGWATGIIIDDSIIATCSHTVSIASTTVVLYNEIPYQTVLLDSTPGIDGIALLKVNAYLVGTAPRITEPELFEEVMIKGYPYGFPNMSLVGMINHIEVDTTTNYDIYNIQIRVNHGISGAGVWNRNGMLVGMVWGVRKVDNMMFTNFLSAKNAVKLYRDYLMLHANSRKFHVQMKGSKP